MNMFYKLFALQVLHGAVDRAFDEESCCDIIEGTEEIKYRYYIRKIIYI